MTTFLLQIWGLLAGACFAWAAVPAAIRTIKAGKHLGTPPDIIISILAGTVLMYTYLLWSYGFNTVLTFNYSIESLSWLVLFYYWLKSRHGQ